MLILQSFQKSQRVWMLILWCGGLYYTEVGLEISKNVTDREINRQTDREKKN